MKNTYLSITGFLGATGVALGALGAHFLKSKMQAGLITADQLGGFETGTKYQLFHTLALFVLFCFARDKESKMLRMAGNLFIAGIILFSGSLYLLTTRNLFGAEGLRVLGPVTPIGGVALIAGWICLMIYGLLSKKN